MEQGFDGRAVLVFGAVGALGSGVSAAFAAAGAVVTGADRVVPDGAALAGVSYEAVDVTDDAAVRALFDSRPAPWAVVNTVGGYAPRRPLAELDAAELATQLELNLVTAALITKHALRVMQPSGQGRIVHTASRAAVATAGTGFAYSVSKLGVLHLVSRCAEQRSRSTAWCRASSTPRPTGPRSRAPTTINGRRWRTSPPATCTSPAPRRPW